MVQDLQRKHGSVEWLHGLNADKLPQLLVKEQLRKNTTSSILHQSDVFTALLDLRDVLVRTLCRLLRGGLWYIRCPEKGGASAPRMEERGSTRLSCTTVLPNALKSKLRILSAIVQTRISDFSQLKSMDDVHSEGYSCSLHRLHKSRYEVKTRARSYLTSLHRHPISGVAFKQGFRPDSGQLLH